MSLPSASLRVACTQLGDAEPPRDVTRAIAEEVPVNIIFNELHPYAVMMASPLNLDDFAYGFSFTERIVEEITAIRDVRIEAAEDGIDLHIRISGTDLSRLMQRGRRALTGRTGCGICGTDKLETRAYASGPKLHGASVSLPSVRRALCDLSTHQTLNALTHMVHGAAWFDVDGKLIALREDVGRHNALDKLIGGHLRHGRDFRLGFCVLTSRYSFEMAEKTARAGMALVAAISAPTARALRVAEETGQTVLAIARRDGQLLFAGGDILRHTETS